MVEFETWNSFAMACAFIQTISQFDMNCNREFLSSFARRSSIIKYEFISNAFIVYANTHAYTNTQRERYMHIYVPLHTEMILPLHKAKPNRRVSKTKNIHISIQHTMN